MTEEHLPEQVPVVDWMCRHIVKRHLTTPALVALEMSRPLNFIGSQAMHFLRPVVAAVVSTHGYEGYKQLATFLEQRGSIEYICRRLEAMEAEKKRLEEELKNLPGGPPPRF